MWFAFEDLTTKEHKGGTKGHRGKNSKQFLKKEKIMKKVIVLVVAVVMMIGTNAQGCLPEGIIFYTQEEIDNFQANYPGCTEIEGYVTINGSDIIDLNGLNSITSIGGYLEIMDCIELTKLSGLSNLTSIGSDGIGVFSLTICGNQLLSSLSGLENITFLIRALDISSNMKLSSLEGLNNLAYIGGFGLGITDNPSLKDLSVLESLGTAETVLIGCNDSLINLSGLNNLTSISHYLNISDNFRLSNIEELENLLYVGLGIKIDDNEMLESMEGLGNIDANSLNDLKIYNNSLLSVCDVNSVCQYLSLPNASIEIHDNAYGCNSPEEVEEACLTSIADIKTGNELTVTPNPANANITVSIPVCSENAKLSIFNVNGEELLERHLTNTEIQLDISAPPRGVYFVRVQDENQVQITKLIKQ